MGTEPYVERDGMEMQSVGEGSEAASLQWD